MQQQKMHMSKKQFRIGDLAKELKVKKFVIRFWEKEFDIQSDRSGGGQRFYTIDDLKTFLFIKDLLYNQGFTIAGAKKQLDVFSKSGALVLDAEIVPAQIQGATQDMTAGDDAQAIEHDGCTTIFETVQEAEALPGLIKSAEYFQSATSIIEQEMTPATLVGCECSSVVQKLGVLKAQLAELKMLLERSMK